MTLHLEELISLDDLSDITKVDRCKLIKRMIQNEIRPVKDYQFTYQQALQIKHMIVGNYPLSMSDITFLSNVISNDISDYKKINYLTDLLLYPYCDTAIQTHYQIGVFVDIEFTKEWLLILKETYDYEINTTYLKDDFSKHAFHMLQSDAGCVYEKCQNENSLQLFDELLLKFKSIQFSDDPFRLTIELIEYCLFELPNYEYYQYIKYSIKDIVKLFKQIIVDYFVIDSNSDFKFKCEQLCVGLLSVHLPIQSHLKTVSHLRLDIKRTVISNQKLNEWLRKQFMVIFPDLKIEYVEINKVINNGLKRSFDAHIQYEVVLYLKENDGCISKAETLKLPVMYDSIKNIDSIDDFDTFFESLISPENTKNWSI